MPAIQSENPIIAGATKKLIDSNWPDYLLIYDGNYLQNVLYNDTVPGIQWYIVVLLPANVQVDHLGPDSSLYGAVIAIASISIAASVIGIIITLVYLKTRLIRLTRPVFTLIILTGALSLSIYCILLLGSNTDISCTVRPWLFNLAFTLSFSPLLIKSYMVHWLFNLNPLAKNKLIPTHVLLSFTFLFVAIDAFLVGVTAYVGGSGTKAISTTKLTSNDAYGEITYCSTTANRVFLYVEIAYKGLLVGAACLLSFLVRRIPGTIAGSKVLVVTVYNVACISGVILLVIHSVTDVGVSILIQAVGICICCMMTVGLMIVPTFYQLVTIGDDNAADDVLEEVFSKSASTTRDVHVRQNRESNVSIIILLTPYNKNIFIVLFLPFVGG